MIRLLLNLAWYLPLILLGRATLSDLIASLGVFYIKLAQTISTRPDLFPSTFIENLRDLQDQVPSTLNLDDCLASGSIAEVYDLGDRVIKIKRSKVDRYVKADYDMFSSCLKMKFIRWIIRRIWSEAVLEGLTKIVYLIDSNISNHLNFKREANMMIRFRKLFLDNSQVIIPQVYHSTNNFIIIEKIDGVHIDRVASEQRAEILRNFLKLVYDMIFQHHLVHGDLHEGNFLIQNNKIALLDFGLVHEITIEQATLIKIFLRVINKPEEEDFEMMAQLMCQNKDYYEQFSNDLLILFQKEKKDLYSFLDELLILFKKHRVDFDESLLTPLLLMVTAEGISKKYNGPNFLSILDEL